MELILWWLECDGTTRVTISVHLMPLWRTKCSADSCELSVSVAPNIQITCYCLIGVDPAASPDHVDGEYQKYTTTLVMHKNIKTWFWLFFKRISNLVRLISQSVVCVCVCTSTSRQVCETRRRGDHLAWSICRSWPSQGSLMLKRGGFHLLPLIFINSGFHIEIKTRGRHNNSVNHSLLTSHTHWHTHTFPLLPSHTAHKTSESVDQ